MGRSDRIASIGMLDLPLFVDGAVGLAHMALGSWLSSGMIRDLQSSVVFTVNDTEVALPVGNKPPFLVEVAMTLVDDEFAAFLWISACVH